MKKYDRSKARDWTGGRYVGAMGKSSISIACPFCDYHFIAYVWSLAGCGKKCPQCGAIHASFGVAYPLS